MSVVVQQVSKTQLRQAVSNLSAPDLVKFDDFIQTTQHLYAGYHDGNLVCVWGLMVPTLLSDAYIWLYVTPAIDGNEFLFIRHSQRMVERMLEEHGRIIGHTEMKNTRAIRWLKWLGAVFGEPTGQLVPFTIRGKRG